MCSALSYHPWHDFSSYFRSTPILHYEFFFGDLLVAAVSMSVADD